jgi:hypothetical protein
MVMGVAGATKTRRTQSTPQAITARFRREFGMPPKLFARISAVTPIQEQVSLVPLVRNRLCID